jgi:hypothetical protein
MNLFDKSVEKLQLFKAVDNIKDQFGNNVIMKAIGLQTEKAKTRKKK